VSRPRVLLLLLDNWHGVARLPAALHDAGFEVGLVSEPHFFAAKSRYVDRHFPISVRELRRGRLKSVWQAIEAFAPTFFIPADEYSVRFAEFVLTHSLRLKLSAEVRQLLDFSVAKLSTPSLIGRRARMLDFAEKLGFDCPSHRIVSSLHEATEFADRHGWPVYLKRDHSSGGYWVKECASESELAEAYRYLRSENRSTWSINTLRRLPKHIARSFVFRASPISLTAAETAISIESAVQGVPAYHTAVALQGRWLAGISAEVEDYYPRPTGPSTRVRLHSDDAMDEAACTLVAALSYSGFCGLDFIRRPDGRLTFLEFNARPTPVVHLGSLIGADLCAALRQALDGIHAPLPQPSGEMRVALFPQDWRRPPTAVCRDNLYLDIPRQDPALLDAFKLVLPIDWDRPGPFTGQGQLADA
jgi:hypothetical protein